MAVFALSDFENQRTFTSESKITYRTYYRPYPKVAHYYMNQIDFARDG